MEALWLTAILPAALMPGAIPSRNAQPTISACLVVRNEEAVIGRCLESIDGVVDEIVLVHDGPCEDRTLEIAESHGARCFVQEHAGPEHHRVLAYEQARGDWLLRLDADEFLSPELRANLRELAARPGVNGYSFLWRMWDGEKYISDRGAYRLALLRRDHTHLLGMLSAFEEVDGPVERSDLQLEHRPLYNNFRLGVIGTKWRAWAKIQARALLTPLEEIPKFNYRGPSHWPWWRGVVNRLSPVLIVPAALVRVAIALRRHRSDYTPLENVRFAVYQGIYAAMVQAYVAKILYVDRDRT
jgi:glycosyltransferase involved in cell wall biosynthesis